MADQKEVVSIYLEITLVSQLQSFGEESQGTPELSNDMNVRVGPLYYTDPSGTPWQCSTKATGADSALQQQYRNLDEKNSHTGFLIDPNTPITVLNREAYTQLVIVIMAYFEAAFKWFPLPSFDLSELCYVEEAESDLEYPVIGLHFKSSFDGDGEVTLNLPPESVFKKNPIPVPGFCLHIQSTSGPSIFGAYQQSNHRFLFDVNAKQLSFAEDNCL
ncbi:aspartic proteinase CDR1-like [Silene latifolia]|uniref:aspartic proteinase CDR1-like n=1 Tax=Silene latifolia TaxID=37657 RepID=UPI003D77C9D8